MTGLLDGGPSPTELLRYVSRHNKVAFIFPKYTLLSCCSCLIFYIYYITNLLFCQNCQASSTHIHRYTMAQNDRTNGPYGVPTRVSWYLTGCPARIRTEVIAFRGHPVLETGVLGRYTTGRYAYLLEYVMIYINPTQLNYCFICIHLAILRRFIYDGINRASLAAASAYNHIVIPNSANILTETGVPISYLDRMSII